MGVFWVMHDFLVENGPERRQKPFRVIVETPLEGDEVAVLAKALEDKVFPGNQLQVRQMADGSGIILRREPIAIPANRIANVKPYGFQLHEQDA